MNMKSLRSVLFFATMVIAASFGKVSAQQVFKTTSSSKIAFYEYVPADYNSNSNKYPVVIFLHGIGERGPNTTDVQILKDNIYKVAKLGPPMYVKNGTQFPFILISPQLKNNYGTWPSSYVMEVLNYVKTYLRIDERRIYITGLSLGGGGTWVTIQDYPELFAAALPVCGGYNSPSKAYKIAAENLPVWASHGSIDDVVPMSKTVNMVNAINASTPKPSPLAKLTIYTGVKHNAWSYAYRTDHSLHTPNVYEWLISYTNTSNKGNKIPLANAGADQTRYLSATTSTSIIGSATDLDGTISTYEWTKLSGPGATLSGTTSKTLKVASLKKGTYIFRLKVKDNSGNTESDYVKVYVKD
jgi:predicted peptidase